MDKIDKESLIKEVVELIMSSFSRDLNESEQQKLQEWLDCSQNNRELYKRLSDKDHILTSYQQYSNIDTPAAWERVRERRSRYIFKRVWIAAASVLLLIGGSGLGWRLHDLHIINNRKQHEKQILASMPGNGKVTLILSDSVRVPLGDTVLTAGIEAEGIVSGNNKLLSYKNTDKNSAAETMWHTLVVDQGAEFSLSLSDGTVVHLNSGSMLRYPVSFSGKERKVFLQGEGYFDVKHDQIKMFIVDGGNFDVAVHGTSFNVSNYRDDLTHDVTLVDGRVSVSCNDRDYELTPDHQLVIEAGAVSVRPIMARNSIAWIDDSFYFNSERFEHITKELSRWYGIEIVFQGSSEKDYLFTGFIPKYAQIGQVLDVLRQTRDFDVDVREGRVVVIGK